MERILLQKSFRRNEKCNNYCSYWESYSKWIIWRSWSIDKDGKQKDWIVYKGGKEMKKLPSYTQPGSEGNAINILNYIKMLIYEMVK